MGATSVDVCGRQRGCKYADLKARHPINPLCNALLFYRFYRLENFSVDHMPQGSCKVRDYIKLMALSLRHHYFSGEDPILVLDVKVLFV